MNLLKQVEEQEKAAIKFGLAWEKMEQLVEQARSECLEIQEAWDKGDRVHLQEEIGDLIQMAISFAVFCNFDTEETLQNSSKKFQKRYDAIVSMVKRDGLESLHGQSFEVLMKYWNQAKATGGNHG